MYLTCPVKYLKNELQQENSFLFFPTGYIWNLLPE